MNMLTLVLGVPQEMCKLDNKACYIEFHLSIIIHYFWEILAIYAVAKQQPVSITSLIRSSWKWSWSSERNYRITMELVMQIFILFRNTSTLEKDEE